MSPQQIFDTIKQFNTVQQIKDWATSIGFDLNPCYDDYDDTNDHPNYQKFFHLDVLLSEMRDHTEGSFTIFIDPTGGDVLAEHESESYYEEMIANCTETHVVDAA